MTDEQKPVAWMYTLEYGSTIANTVVSQRQLNYPFGICGNDYLRSRGGEISYVRQTPLHIHPAPDVLRQLLNILGPTAPACSGCKEEWQAAIDLIKKELK